MLKKFNKKLTIISTFIVSFIVLFFVFLPSIYGFTVKGGENITIKEDINDDLYISGNSVYITGQVSGDLVAAGGQLNINGPVSQDLIVAGGQININSDIGDDIRAAGGTINIDGNIKGDVVIAGGQLNILEGTIIEGDLVLMGANASIYGEVKGKVLASGGQIKLSGKVENSVEISSVGTLKVDDNAQIYGDLIYSSSRKADISPNAKITGNVEFTEIDSKAKADKMDKFKGLKIFGVPFGFLSVIFGASIVAKIISFISIFVLGIILLILIPKVFNKFNERMRTNLGYCVGGGAISLFGIPIAIFIIIIISFILFLTVLGSAVGFVLTLGSLVLLIAYLLAIYINTIFLAYLLGKVILSKSSLNLDKYGWQVLAYFIGLVIIMIIYALPFIGWIARFAGILFGLGGITMILKDLIFNACSKQS